MGTLDWIVIGAFFLALIGIVLWVFKQKQRSSGDYFLAGRDATWLAIGASIFASNIGSEHLIGLAGAGASSGMAMAHWEIQGWMILILGWVFVPFYSRSMVTTMPEFLERRYNSESRTILSLISLVSYVLTKVAVTVYAGGLVFKEVFGIEQMWGIDFFWISAVGLVLLTAIYTVIGGMKSVLYTSVLQTPILLLGSIIIVVLGLRAVGGWDEMMAATSAKVVNNYGDTMTNLIRSNKDPNFPWFGVLIGSSIIGFWYWCTDQFIVQRVLSGKNETESRRGAIFGAYLKMTPVFLFLIPGMIAFAMVQKGVVINGEVFTLSSSDAAFPTLVSKLLPAGLKGLVVCGILAALMSSLASLFNSSAMLFTMDFYKKYKPEATEAKLLRVGRMATVVIVILGMLWIPIMRSIGSVLYTYLQDVQSVLAPGIAAAFLLGILSKRPTPKGGMWGMISGFIIGIIRLGAKVYYSTTATSAGYTDVKVWAAEKGVNDVFYNLFYDTNWLFFCGGMLVFSMLVIMIVSRFTAPASEVQLKGITFSSVSAANKAGTRASWNHWDIIHTAIILTITVAFYIYFW
ncbi:MAG: sodium:solute symporter [Bacteroidota bacterium]|nr:Na+/glucose cotransporter [Odoribacter sp.]MDP3644571.1 sodium:solute symporter [Bacteroidota bacterium]